MLHYLQYIVASLVGLALVLQVCVRRAPELPDGPAFYVAARRVQIAGYLVALLGLLNLTASDVVVYPVFTVSIALVAIAESMACLVALLQPGGQSGAPHAGDTT